MSRSDYEVIGIVIRDLDKGNMSVTNDAEDVVAELADRGRVFYFDSRGQLDELIHDHGVFGGFAHVDTELDETPPVRTRRLLDDEEKYLLDAIVGARRVQELLWGGHNVDWDLEEWRRMFAKRWSKIEAIDPANPHAVIELKKRLLQNAALSVAMIARLDRGGFKRRDESTPPSNLAEYKDSIPHVPADPRPPLAGMTVDAADDAIADLIDDERNNRAHLDGHGTVTVDGRELTATELRGLANIIDAVGD